MGIDFSSFYIYKYRYWIGYGLVSVLLIGLLIFAGMFAPGGITQSEMNSVVDSSNIVYKDIFSFAVPNLPYLLLQDLSTHLLGVSEFSIKLPSLVLAFASAIGLIILLRHWFKQNIAVLASIIAVATGQFLFISQDGTPGILYMLWSVWLLLIGTLIAKNIGPRMVWKILFCIIGALSLYTPLSVYAIVAVGIAAFLHPHLRYIIRRLSRPKLIIAISIGAFFVLPLVGGVIKSPEFGLEILGIPKSLPDLMGNLTLLSRQYFGFSAPSTSDILTPVFGLGSMLIIGFGAFKSIKTHASTQSYLIMTWIICLVPILLINPDFTSVTFLPMVLLLATGLDSLLGYWYRLFPRNPYARIGGLIPIIVLVVALVVSGISRYAYDYSYDPSTVSNFSRDLSLLPKNTSLLVVSENQLPFYSTVASKSDSALFIATKPSGDTFTATRNAKSDFTDYKVSQIITSSYTKDSDRFYVYKKI